MTSELETPRGQTLQARLTALAGDKLDKFGLATSEAAELAVKAVSSRTLKALSVESKPANRNPSAPFMTSTLQQESQPQVWLWRPPDHERRAAPL